MKEQIDTRISRAGFILILPTQQQLKFNRLPHTKWYQMKGEYQMWKNARKVHVIESASNTSIDEEEKYVTIIIWPGFNHTVLSAHTVTRTQVHSDETNTHSRAYTTTYLHQLVANKFDPHLIFTVMSKSRHTLFKQYLRWRYAGFILHCQ